MGSKSYFIDRYTLLEPAWSGHVVLTECHSGNGRILSRKRGTTSRAEIAETTSSTDESLCLGMRIPTELFHIKSGVLPGHHIVKFGDDS